MLETIGVSRFFPVADAGRRPAFARRRNRLLRAVDDVSLSIDGGTTLSLVGESGCGKSATALALLRLIANPPGPHCRRRGPLSQP